MVGRRALGEPLEQVVGFADFCGVRVRLRPGVFVPRVRSELLVRVGRGGRRAGRAVVVDLCCGSGALGLAVRHGSPRSSCTRPTSIRSRSPAPGTTCGERRLPGRSLRRAARRPCAAGSTVLLANVPYVATRHIPLLPAEARDHEPHTALDGGADGLDVFRRVAGAARDWLAPGGILLSEITEAQDEAAVAALRAAGSGR